LSGAGRAQFLQRVFVSRETLARLDTLVAELVRWNASINLVSKRSLGDVWRRHILDSAQLYPLAPPGAQTWVDLGSGAGFPALVVAALAKENNPALRLSLIESDARKCAFLATVARLMAIEITIENRRIQEPPSQRYDIISARALAPLKDLVLLAEPYMTERSVALFLKGAEVNDELTDAFQRRHMRVVRSPSITDPGGVILQLRGIGGVRSGTCGA